MIRGNLSRVVYEDSKTWNGKYIKDEWQRKILYFFENLYHSRKLNMVTFFTVCMLSEISPDLTRQHRWLITSYNLDQVPNFKLVQETRQMSFRVHLTSGNWELAYLFLLLASSRELGLTGHLARVMCFRWAVAMIGWGGGRIGGNGGCCSEWGSADKISLRN